MMLKGSALLVAMVCLINHVSGQVITGKSDSDGKEYQFKVTEKDAGNINNLFVGLDAGVEIGQGFFMGFGVDANYLHDNKLLFKLNWFRPFVPDTDSEHGSYYRGEENNGVKLRLYNKTEFGVTWYFASNVNTKDARVVLKDHEVSANRREVTILKTKIPNTTRYGARLGYYYYQQSVGGSLSIVADTTVTGGDIHVSSFTNHCVYLGISTTSFQHYIVESDEFGKTAKSRFRSYYLDLMLGLGGTADFYSFDNEKKGQYPYDLDKDYSMRNLGFRLGWERINRHTRWEKVGAKMGAEIGWRPVQDIPVLEHGLAETDKKISQLFFTAKFGIFFTTKL